MEQSVEYCDGKRPAEQLFTLLYVDGSVKHGTDKKKKKLSATFENFYYIGHDSTLLPFLSIEDNLLIGVTKKALSDYQHLLNQWAHYFKIKATTLTSKADKITAETCLLIHLVRAFALERELIFIDELSLNLAQDFIDSLIPTLATLANDRQVSIIFMTDRQELIEKYPQQTLYFDDHTSL